MELGRARTDFNSAMNTYNDKAESVADAIVDLTNKGLGEVVPLPAYHDAKDHFTYVPGGHLG